MTGEKNMTEEMTQEKFEEIAEEASMKVSEEGTVVLERITKQTHMKKAKPDLWARLSPKGNGIVFTMLPSEEPIQYSIATSSMKAFLDGGIDVIPIFLIRRNDV